MQCTEQNREYTKQQRTSRLAKPMRIERSQWKSIGKSHLPATKPVICKCKALPYPTETFQSSYNMTARRRTFTILFYIPCQLSMYPLYPLPRIAIQIDLQPIFAQRPDIMWSPTLSSARPTGDKLQQKYLHTANNRHDGESSISGYATSLDHQGTCIPPRLLRVLATEFRGAAADLDLDKGAQAGDIPNSSHAGGQQMWWERRAAGSYGHRGPSRGGRLGRVVHGNVRKN